MKIGLSTIESPSTTDPWATFTPSEHQLAIRDWVLNGKGCANVIAVAGSGKTTTLRWLCRDLKQQGNVAFAAYNKKIADEISAKLQLDGISWQQVSARTFHSFGFAAWRRFAKGVQVNADKVENILGETSIPEEFHSSIKLLVSLAKNHAFGIEREMTDEPWEELIEHYSVISEETEPNDEDEYKARLIRMAIGVLGESKRQDIEVVDFDDMIYAPLAHNTRIWQSDWVLVDEAQDTNPARRLLAKRMLKPGGRAIFVGDPCQAIYGFTGADADALDLIKKEFGSIELPLTITYRCPRKVVEHAQRWVSHIQCAEKAPEGSVDSVDLQTFRRLQSGFDNRTAILCRVTRPLVEIAFDLIRKKIPCHVEGRDIGRGLIVLTRRYKEDDARTLVERIEEWGHGQTQKLISARKDREAQLLNDKISTLRVFVDNMHPGATTHELRSEISKLFDDTPEGQPAQTVTLSTVHKAKGREWPTVYLYGRTSFMPSKFAKQQWQLNQEMNLIYVAVTRTMGRLIEVDLEKVKDAVPVDPQAL